MRASTGSTALARSWSIDSSSELVSRDAAAPLDDGASSLIRSAIMRRSGPLKLEKARRSSGSIS
jgi:hypothetical protein